MSTCGFDNRNDFRIVTFWPRDAFKHAELALQNKMAAWLSESSRTQNLIVLKREPTIRRMGPSHLRVRRLRDSRAVRPKSQKT